jgi:hypothetical protein
MANAFNWDKARMSGLIAGRGYEDITADSRKRQDDIEHKKWLKRMRKKAARIQRAKQSSEMPAKVKEPKNVDRLPGLKSAFHHEKKLNIIDSDEVPWDD